MHMCLCMCVYTTNFWIKSEIQAHSTYLGIYLVNAVFSHVKADIVPKLS